MKAISVEQMANLQGGQQFVPIRPTFRPVLNGSRTTRCVMFGIGGTLAIFGLVTGPIGWAGTAAFAANWALNGSGC